MLRLKENNSSYSALVGEYEGVHLANQKKVIKDSPLSDRLRSENLKEAKDKGEGKGRSCGTSQTQTEMKSDFVRSVSRQWVAEAELARSRWAVFGRVFLDPGDGRTLLTGTHLSLSSLVSSFCVCSSSWRSLMCSSCRSWISAFTAWSLEKSWSQGDRDEERLSKEGAPSLSHPLPHLRLLPF